MLHFSGRIPLTIFPTFWIFAALIGFINSQSIVGTLIWIGIIFVSVLFHEFGHALTAVIFGQNPRIELVALGGLTYHDGQKLSFWKQFLIVFNGPLFGFLLYIIASVLMQFPTLAVGMVGSIINLTRIVNLFWTVVNLLPVMPLDGGQLLRIICESIFGARGFRYALMGSMIVAVLISLFFFLYQSFIIGALFFLLAFQSFDAFRKMRHLTEKDQDEHLRELLSTAEEKIQSGQKPQALELLEEVRKKTQKGMLYNIATQYAAFLQSEVGQFAEVYRLLLPLQKELSGDALCLLHQAAFEQHNYAIVAEIGGVCFQHLPTVESALRNACAHGALGQVQPAVGWLQTAIQEGLANPKEILQDKCFDPIRSDPQFSELTQTLSN